MQISWKITKKRGYVRPTLTYHIDLEAHEKALCLPAMRIASCIPEPIDSWQEHCWPGQFERADPPQVGNPYSLDIPSHQGRHGEQSLRLPWREDNSYPEVEASFCALRKAFEEELARAYASQPMAEEQTLKASPAIKKHLAPGLVAERLLRSAQRMSQAS
ncbi:MAG: hypothetical protein IKN64_08125 [Desulfovibrio sp.]|nr:hypothetical protein [Desulfovibrio sp.]